MPSAGGWARLTTLEGMSIPSLLPRCGQGASCPWHLTCLNVVRKKKTGRVQGLACLIPGLCDRCQCSGDFLWVRKQPPSPGSFWMAKGAMAAGRRGFFVCGTKEEGAVVTRRVRGRSLCWASVCPHACLSVALKEAGAGPAAAWAERLLRGTQLFSLVTDAPLRSPCTSTARVGHQATSPE